MLVPCVTWGLFNVTNWRDTVSLTQVRHPLYQALIVLPLTSITLHALHIGYMAASTSSLGHFLSLDWHVLMFHASAGSFINSYIIASVLCVWNDMMIEPTGQYRSLDFSCIWQFLCLNSQFWPRLIDWMHLHLWSATTQSRFSSIWINECVNAGWTSVAFWDCGAQHSVSGTGSCEWREDKKIQ